MALFRTSSGGGMQETVLWTNQNPGNTFNAQDVSLSSSILNFDYIKIAYNYAYNYASPKGEILVPKEYMIGATKNSPTSCPPVLGALTYGRKIAYTDDTTIYFYLSQQIGSSGSSNYYAIPTQISGIKF